MYRRDPTRLYRDLAKHAPDIRSLSGRPDFARTDLMNSIIRDTMQFGPDDTVLDVGCGDGSLLNAIQSSVPSCLGIVPTSEELQRLREHFPNIAFECGRIEAMQLPRRQFTKIVMNGVLQLLLSHADAASALKKWLTHWRRMVCFGSVRSQADTPA